MTIELLQPHTHAGVLYPRGTRLDLDETAARWLIERGGAQPVATPATPASDTKPAIPSRKGD